MLSGLFKKNQEKSGNYKHQNKYNVVGYKFKLDI
jgi:hypothetical protein